MTTVKRCHSRKRSTRLFFPSHSSLLLFLFLATTTIWAIFQPTLVAVVLASAGGGKIGGGVVLRNLVRGSALRCICDLSGGLPLEVWKTLVIFEHQQQGCERMMLGKKNSSSGTKKRASNGCRGEQQQSSSSTSSVNAITILQRTIQERGITHMWSGWSARMVEGALSGAVLLAAKESIHKVLETTPFIARHVAPSIIGFVAGAGGGAAQALVMTPCSLLVTATTTANGESVTLAVQDIWSQHGLRGLYRGTPAVMARQMTNWASRQGFTELVRPHIATSIGGRVQGEILAGCIGGMLSTWNTPFEVARITSQSNSFGSGAGTDEVGNGNTNLLSTLQCIVEERGVGGLYAGLVPRICQACYQTVFMVCVPHILDAT